MITFFLRHADNLLSISLSSRELTVGGIKACYQEWIQHVLHKNDIPASDVLLSFKDQPLRDEQVLMDLGIELNDTIWLSAKNEMTSTIEVSSNRLVQQALKCPVCREYFIDPRVLICGHTFCHECCKIVELRVVCPSCKKHTSIRLGTNEESLPPNFNLAKILDAIPEVKAEVEQRRLGKEYQHRGKFKYTFHRDVVPKAIVFSSSGGTMETKGISVVIPTNAVQEKTNFGVCQLDIPLPENIIPITPTYELTPHNTRFGEPITLTFDIPPSISCGIALYKQKEDTFDKELEKWLVVMNPERTQDGKVTFKVKSFSSITIGFQPDVHCTNSSPNAPIDPVYETNRQIVKPGVNYCIRCPCFAADEFFVIPRGYSEGSDCDVSDDLAANTCYRCDGLLSGVDLVNIIFFQTEGVIKTRKCGKREKPTPTNFAALDGNFVVCCSSQSTSRFDVLKIEARLPMSNPTPSTQIAVTLDVMGNYVGKGNDLGRDGAFNHIKLLVGHFFTEEGFTAKWFNDSIVAALNTKGFKIKVTQNEADFLQSLKDYDVIWIFPTIQPVQDPTFAQKIKAFYETGRKGILFWEDNDSIATSSTNASLSLLFGFTVGGNDPGNEIMNEAPHTNSALTFDKNHMISKGIIQLYEGITISYPQDTLPANFKVFSRSSANRPNIMYRDEQRGTNSRGESVTFGRVIVDCGFTKLFPGLWQQTKGTAVYVINATVWLAGLHDNEDS